MRRLNSMGWVAAALVTAACGGEGTPRETTTATTQTLLAQPRGEELSTEIDASRLGSGSPALDLDLLGVNVGSPEAPVKVIEFVDYGCGYCRQFQLETWPAVLSEFIETGMVEWKFMPFVSGMFANSRAVTFASECALNEDPGLFAAFSYLLWARQPEWKQSDDAASLVRQWIVDLGGQAAAFDSCLAQGDRNQRVTSATALASELGIRSTPTFWIVGLGPVQGALPIAVFRQILTEVHEQVTAETPADAA